MKPSQTVPVPDFSKRYVYNDVMVLVVFLWYCDCDIYLL